MHARSAFMGLVILVVAACTKPADQAAMTMPAVDSTAVRNGIADFWQRWIVVDTANDVPGQVALLTDSVRVDARGMPPIMGKAGWQDAMASMSKDTKYTSLVVTPDLTVPVSNELGYQNGSYAESSTTKGKASMEFGRYATAIRKEADGQWRLAYIMVFADSTVSKK